MTVRGAVEAVDQAKAENGNGKPALATVVRQSIEAQSAAFSAVLPSTVDPDRFARLTLTAVKAAPDLIQCFATDEGRTSVLIAAMQAAAVGLEPNTPTQEAWILPRKEKGKQLAELQIGYRGYLKLARRSGQIKTVYANVVRDGDEFDWYYGLEADHLEHKPAPANTGALTHAYAVVRYTNGGYNFVVLDATEVEQRRAMSRSAKSDYSPWNKWEAAMWRKSAIRALVPYMELQPEAARAVDNDDRGPLRFDTNAGEITVDENLIGPGELDDEPEVSE